MTFVSYTPVTTPPDPYADAVVLLWEDGADQSRHHRRTEVELPVRFFNTTDFDFTGDFTIEVEFELTAPLSLVTKGSTWAVSRTGFSGRDTSLRGLTPPVSSIKILRVADTAHLFFDGVEVDRKMLFGPLEHSDSYLTISQGVTYVRLTAGARK